MSGPPHLLPPAKDQESQAEQPRETEFPFIVCPVPSTPPSLGPAPELPVAAHCLPATGQLLTLTPEAFPVAPYLLSYLISPTSTLHPHRSLISATPGCADFPKCLPVSIPPDRLHVLFLCLEPHVLPASLWKTLLILPGPLQMGPFSETAENQPLSSSGLLHTVDTHLWHHPTMSHLKRTLGIIQS